MIALQYDQFGEPAAVLTPRELPTPQPGEGEVLLKMLASPIHNHDLATVRGIYGVKPKLPATGGTEMAGVVESTGQRVAAMVPGAWSEYAIASAATIVPVPPNVDDATASQLIAMPLSTVLLYESLEVKSGDWIVQNAANGAVGRMLMRLAQRDGVGIVNLVRRASSADELRAFGAEHVVVTEDNADWAKETREIAGDGKIRRVVDSVCDAHSTTLNRMLAPYGEHVVFGALGARALALDPGALIFGETVVRGFWVSHRLPRMEASARAAAMMRTVGLVASGDLPLPVDSSYRLSDVKEAVARAETPGRSGKILFVA